MQTGDPRQAAIFTAALNLNEKDPVVRKAALSGLSALDGADATRTLIDETRRSDNTALRLVAVRALGDRRSPTATSQLEVLTQDKNDSVAATALRVLARSSPSRAAGAATLAMQSSDPHTRRRALGIALLLPRDVGQSILASAARDSDGATLQEAISQLSTMGGPESERALVDLLNRANAPDDAKHAAARALSEMGGSIATANESLIERFKERAAADELSEGSSASGLRGEGGPDEGE